MNGYAPPSAPQMDRYPPPSAPQMEGPAGTRLAVGPMHNPVQRRSPVEWSSGLCQCCNNCSVCCLTCWCPCITFGRIAEITDRGSTSCGVSATLYALILAVTGCSCLYSCFYRTKMRSQYLLEDKPCADCCVHLFCEVCALCQEYRELQHQGFDLSIGWQGNVERMNKGNSATALPPPLHQGMNR